MLGQTTLQTQTIRTASLKLESPICNTSEFGLSLISRPTKLKRRWSSITPAHTLCNENIKPTHLKLMTTEAVFAWLKDIWSKMSTKNHGTPNKTATRLVLRVKNSWDVNGRDTQKSGTNKNCLSMIVGPPGTEWPSDSKVEDEMKLLLWRTPALKDLVTFFLYVSVDVFGLRLFVGLCLGFLFFCIRSDLSLRCRNTQSYSKIYYCLIKIVDFILGTCPASLTSANRSLQSFTTTPTCSIEEFVVVLFESGWLKPFLLITV